jgi:hypothetical protein
VFVAAGVWVAGDEDRRRLGAERACWTRIQKPPSTAISRGRRPSRFSPTTVAGSTSLSFSAPILLTRSLHRVVLITVPSIAFGGVRLLTMIFRREPGYLDNPVRQNLWRAGHAHAGVLVILTLVGLLLVD